MNQKDRSNIISLVERHIIKDSHSYYDELLHLTHLSKNLYNATLYEARKSFFDDNYKNYYTINKEFTHSNQSDYRALPAKVAKQTQLLVDKAFKSYFKLKDKVKSGTYDKKVKLPKYLNKDGHFVITYEKGALSFKQKGYIKLSKTNILIKTNLSKETVTCVRIVPKGNHFVIEICYDILKPRIVIDYTRVAMVDPGMNNLMTVTSNVFTPLIYNGKPIKSINQYYNKIKSKNQSLLEQQISNVDRLLNNTKINYNSKLLTSISFWRREQILNYFHKTTTHLVNHLVKHDIKTLIFGHNNGQKQDIKLSKKTNQNFVTIPFTMLISQLSYKCERAGINFVITEESHTSKCSFIDQEVIGHHDNYVGKRIKRGLFKSSNGKVINADINGSLNIGRKYLTKIESYTQELHHQLINCMKNPMRVTVHI